MTRKSPRPAKAPRSGTLELFRARLRSFEREIAGPQPAAGAVAAAIEDLQMALEEVEVAEEEMALQNEELMAVRELLEAERQRYRDLFDFAPDGYLVTNLAGTIREANLAASQLLHASAKALRGKPLAVFVAEGERPAFRALFPRLAAGERLADCEVTLTPRGRAPIPAFLTIARDGEASSGAPDLRWIIRDVSARKATERALRESEERLRHAQRLESVGRLAGGIAHSFNNLLAAIAFHAELLGDGLPPEPRLLAHLDAIQAAGERAATLASQLLAFGRKQVLSPRRLLINEVLGEMGALLRQLIGEDVLLETRLDPAAGAVDADMAQLEQVILNLVVNARDAMPEGGRCTIETAAVELAGPGEGGALDLPAGSYVRLAVADTGTGIPDEIKVHIFEPFFTTKDREKGTGLGLATVYGIVRQSGGNLRVESAPGAGTRFEVYLPRVAAEPGAEAPPVRRERRRPARGSEVILLVEDEENIRQPAIEVLESQGYQVLAAANGADALALAAERQGPIHLMVTDVIMPGMSGSQLAERLQPARPAMKVLYISGYPEDSIAQHGVLDAGKCFLQKPFPPSRFLRAVRDVLDAPAPGCG